MIWIRIVIFYKELSFVLCRQRIFLSNALWNSLGFLSSFLYSFHILFLFSFPHQNSELSYMFILQMAQFRTGLSTWENMDILAQCEMDITCTSSQIIHTWCVHKVSNLIFSRINQWSAGGSLRWRCGGDIHAQSWIFSRPQKASVTGSRQCYTPSSESFRI
jgi:hypothetical protein